jgi:NADH-quinone oxidoreductase subunit F
MASFKIDDKIYKKELVLDKNLLGTIALISNPTSNYRFAKIVLNKEQN